MKSNGDNVDYAKRRPSEREVLFRDAQNVPDANMHDISKGLVSLPRQNLALSQAIRDHHHLQNDHDHDVFVKGLCHLIHNSMKIQPPCVYRIKRGHSQQSLSHNKNGPTLFMSDFEFKKYQHCQDRLKYPHQLYDDFLKDGINPTKLFIKPFSQTPSHQKHNEHQSLPSNTKPSSILDDWRQYYPIPQNQTSTFFTHLPNYQLSSLNHFLVRQSIQHHHHYEMEMLLKYHTTHNLTAVMMMMMMMMKFVRPLQ